TSVVLHPTHPPADPPPLSLHAALPISLRPLLGRVRTHRLPAFRDRLLPAAGILHRQAHRLLRRRRAGRAQDGARLSAAKDVVGRSEEHTSELQSRENLVCRLLLEKKKR